MRPALLGPLVLLAGCSGLDVPPRGPLALHDLAYTSVDWLSAREGAEGNDELRLLRTDGTVDVLVQARPDGRISGAAWSPDGTTVAYSVSLDDPINGEKRSRLERVQPGGAPETLADLEGGSVLDPSWSPDGTRVLALLESPPSLRGVPRVLLVDAHGGKARLLSPPGQDVTWPRWSRDGRLALYLVRFADQSSELRAVEVDTGKSWVIAHEPPKVPVEFAVAPDVDRVLINITDRTFTVDMDGNDLREIGQGWGESFAYAPGGDLLAFLRRINEDDDWLFVSTPAGEHLHAAAATPVKGRFAWAPGGGWLAFSTATGRIEVRSASGKDIVEATDGDRLDLDPAWRP